MRRKEGLEEKGRFGAERKKEGRECVCEYECEYVSEYVYGRECMGECVRVCVVGGVWKRKELEDRYWFGLVW